MPTVSYGIANTADDAYSSPSLGLNGNEGVVLGDTGGFKVWAAWRFQAVLAGIDAGATITAASLILKENAAGPVLGGGGSGTNLGRIYASAEADSAAFVPSDIPSIAKGTAFAAATYGGATTTLDVLALIQEWKGRAGWVPGNDLTLVGDPTTSTANHIREFFDYSASTTNCAQLLITFDTGGGGINAAAIITEQPDTVAATATTPAPPLSFIGAATGTTSATIPAHQAGDLIICWAYRDGSNTLPTLPSGQNWTALNGVTGANTNSAYLVAKVATSSSEATGTFTSATSVVVNVYRPKAGYTTTWGAVAAATGASTTVNYPALTLQTTDGTSWVAGFAGHRSVNTALENPPAGMLNRAVVVDATDEAVSHDTGGGVTSWSSTNVSVGGTSSGWRAATVELKAIETAGGVTATANITESPDTVTATAIVLINASASITEAPDTSTAAGSVGIAAAASITEANDTVAATVTVAFPAITATANITEDPDTLAAATVLRISVTAAITEGADTATSTATALIQATATIGESPDTLTATVAVVTGIAASADITEEPDTLSATSTVRITAQAVVNESSDTLEAIVEITATLTGRAIVMIIG